MSKIRSSTESIEFKLLTGTEKKFFNEASPYEFISVIANQDVSVQLTLSESKTLKRVVQVKLDDTDEKTLVDLYKKISKQIDITTHE
jgi:hypothetical protein